ncbi:hypothetical protein Tco_1344911 [Tanacetum coccineum]
MPTEMELTLEQTQQGVSYEVSVFTMKMEILLEPTSNKLMVAGNPVKKILLKLNLSDHKSILTDLKVSPTNPGIKVKEVQRSFRHSDTERLSRSDEVLKLKNFKKDATLKLSKSTNQERYEHSLKITMSNTSSRNKLNPEVNDHYNIFSRESQEYELKTKDEA